MEKRIRRPNFEKALELLGKNLRIQAAEKSTEVAMARQGAVNVDKTIGLLWFFVKMYCRNGVYIRVGE